MFEVRTMITDIVWTDDSKLLQESNSTVRQQRRAPNHVLISFNKRRRLASKGLVNLSGVGDANTGSPALRAEMLSATLRHTCTYDNVSHYRNRIYEGL